MKITTIILSLLMIISISINAQKVNPKHVNWYKVPDKIDGNHYQVVLSRIVSKVDYIKMGIKIINTGSNYLMFNKGESEYIYKDSKYSDKEKYVYIMPTKSKIKTIKATGANMFHVDTVEFVLKGLYTISVDGKVTKVNDFKLPAAKNSIEEGNFKIKLIKVKQETQETWAKFECTYVGNDIGIISPSKLSVKVEGMDVEYANDYKKAGNKILRKGESAKFSAIFHIPAKITDMQFSNLLINWNDTFKESKAKKIDEKKFELIVDPALTQGKNK